MLVPMGTSSEGNGNQALNSPGVASHTFWESTGIPLLSFVTGGYMCKVEDGMSLGWSR